MCKKQWSAIVRRNCSSRSLIYSALSSRIDFKRCSTEHREEERKWACLLDKEEPLLMSQVLRNPFYSTSKEPFRARALVRRTPEAMLIWKKVCLKPHSETLTSIQCMSSSWGQMVQIVIKLLKSVPISTTSACRIFLMEIISSISRRKQT